MSNKPKQMVSTMIVGLFLSGGIPMCLSFCSNSANAETPLFGNLGPILYYSFDNVNYKTAQQPHDIHDDSGHSRDADFFDNRGIPGTQNLCDRVAYFTGESLYGLGIRFGYRLSLFPAEEYDVVGGYRVTQNPPNQLQTLQTLTIEAWVFWEGDTKATIAGQEHNFWFYIDDQNKLCFRTGINNPNEPVFSSTNTIKLHQWTHVAVTRYQTSLPAGWIVCLWINGRLDSSSYNLWAFGNPPVPVPDTYIGVWKPSWYAQQNPPLQGSDVFRGVIDEFRIFDGAKTPSDGLGRNVLKLGFEEGTGSVVYDRSGTGHNGEDINELVGTLEGSCADQNSIWASVSAQNTVPVPPGSARCFHFSPNQNTNPQDRTYLQFEGWAEFDIAGSLTIDTWIKWDMRWEGNPNNADPTKNLQTIAYVEDNYWFGIIKIIQGVNINEYLMFCNGKAVGSQDCVIGVTDIASLGTPWVHVGVTRDSDGTGGNSVKLYLANKLDNQGQLILPTSASSSTLYLGAMKNPGNNNKVSWFFGSVDNFNIYNYVKVWQQEQLRYTFENVDAQGRVKDEAMGDRPGTILPTGGVISDPEWTAEDYGKAFKAYQTMQGIEIQNNPDLKITGDLTIEARIFRYEGCQPARGTIVWADTYYWLVLVDHGQYGTLEFYDTHDTTRPVVAGNLKIPNAEWTYVSAIRFGDGTSANSVKLYVNGVLDNSGNLQYSYQQGINNQINPARPAAVKTYIFTDPPANSHSIRGKIDNVVIYSSIKTGVEDHDSDGMSDSYEMMRTAGTNQDNPLEYNGRFALLAAPFQDNSIFIYKSDITQLRYYLIANGWSDCDIIFLTQTDNNHGITVNPRNSAQSQDISNDWIDGDAFRQNIYAALDGLSTGGAISLLTDPSTSDNVYLGKPSNRDTVLIEFRGTGDTDPEINPPEYKLMAYDDGDYELDDYEDGYIDPSSVATKIDSIPSRTMVVELDFDHAGSWVSTLDSVEKDRIILTSCDSDETVAEAYMLYSRLRGETRADYSKFYQIGEWINWDQENNRPLYKDLNADGVTGIDPITHLVTRDSINFPCNGIVSIQEAHYYASDMVINWDWQVTQQTPQIAYHMNVPDPCYL